jgi:hypothetical protein
MIRLKVVPGNWPLNSRVMCLNSLYAVDIYKIVQIGEMKKKTCFKQLKQFKKLKSGACKGIQPLNKIWCNQLPSELINK